MSSGHDGLTTSGGRVEALHVAPSSAAPMEQRESVAAVAGQGLRGDRYFAERGTFSAELSDGWHLTLIEAEAVEAIGREADIHLEPGEHRRNITTRGVALNHLVGERFRIGDTVCEGRRLCEPCRHLEGLTEDGVLQGLIHRGGLRADIVESGEIRVGDPVESE